MECVKVIQLRLSNKSLSEHIPQHITKSLQLFRSYSLLQVGWLTRTVLHDHCNLSKAHVMLRQTLNSGELNKSRSSSTGSTHSTERLANAVSSKVLYLPSDYAIFQSLHLIQVCVNGLYVQHTKNYQARYSIIAAVTCPTLLRYRQDIALLSDKFPSHLSLSWQTHVGSQQCETLNHKRATDGP